MLIIPSVTALITHHGGQTRAQLRRVRAPRTRTRELFTTLQDVVPGNEGVEGRGVGDEQWFTFLHPDTGPDLEPVLGPEDQSTVWDTAVVE